MSHFVNGLSQWGTIWFLSVYAGKEMLGSFSLANAVVTPVMLLAGLDLRTVQATDQRGCYASGLILQLKSAGLVLGFFCLACYGFFQHKLEISLSLVVGLAAARGWEMLSDVAHGTFQQAHRGDLVAKSRIFRAAVMLTVLVIVFLLSNSISATALVLAFVSAAITLAFDRRMVRALSLSEQEVSEKNHSGCHRNSQDLYSLVLAALPVGLTFALISLTVYIQRFWLGLTAGNAVVGSYTVCSAFPLAMVGVSNATTAAALPRLSKFWQSGQKAKGRLLFLKLLLANGVIGISATVLLTASAHPLLSVFGRPQESELILFRLLALSVGIRCFSFALSTYVRSHRAFYPLLLCEAFAVSVLMVALSVGRAVDLPDVGWATVISAFAATIAYGLATAVLWNQRCTQGIK